MSQEELRHDVEAKSSQLGDIDDVFQSVQGVGQVDGDVWQIFHPIPESSVDIMEASGWSSSQDSRDWDGFQRLEVGVDHSWHPVESEVRISRPHF